jgi:hypothetical protein
VRESTSVTLVAACVCTFLAAASWTSAAAVGVTTRVSVSSEGAEAGRACEEPSISPDGRYVAFYSKASNLVPVDTNEDGDVFVHDRETGKTIRVSVSSDGAQGKGDSSRAAISASG